MKDEIRKRYFSFFIMLLLRADSVIGHKKHKKAQKLFQPFGRFPSDAQVPEENHKQASGNLEFPRPWFFNQRNR
jgi:hypothetical protein